MYYAIAPRAERFVNSLFQFFAPTLKTDNTLRRDGMKLKKRLSLRDNGACCVGFGNSNCYSKDSRK